MQIFVAVRQALDWTTSTRDFRIDPVTHEVVASFARYRIDQFDEMALETGLQLRDRQGGAVRALTVGAADADDVLRHALAMGADHATLIDATGAAASTAELLAAAIRQYDAEILLCGRTSSGGGSGRTGPAVAELLGVPFIANVVGIDAEADGCLCRCETAFGFEVLKVSGPFVASVTNDATNRPRVPGMKDVMRAHRSKLETLAGDILTTGPAASATSLPQPHVLKRYIPVMSRSCRRIGGETPEQARALAQYIRSVAGVR